MTQVFVHELAGQGEVLTDRLREVLERADGPLSAELLSRARIETRGISRMVLTGQYSSGKSSLIKALTDGAVDPHIDADIATDQITDYEWDKAVVLVDTPGVKSGLREHDDLAKIAVGEANFILFVITVGGFDDASSAYLRRLVNDLQLHAQTIVVITQTGMQSAEPGLRQAAVQQALGTTSFNLPIVEVDSVYYLESLQGGPRAEMRRQLSGIDDLRGEINRISLDRGDIAALRQPLQLVRQLCDEAQSLFVDDERSRIALGLLASRRAAISERRLMIDLLFRTTETEFKSSCLVDVTGFVDAVTSLPIDGREPEAALGEAQDRLTEALDRHAQQFANSINRLVAAQTDKLTEQLLEIGDSNRAVQLLSVPPQVTLSGPRGIDRPRRSDADGQSKGDSGGVDWGQVSDQLKHGQTWWGAGKGAGQSAGTQGHQVVKEVGHLFGKKFRPWEAVKIADKIGKAAKIGGFVLQIGLAGYEVYRGERDARSAQLESERQHAAFVTEIMGHASKITSEARIQLAGAVDPPLNAFLAKDQEIQNEILGADVLRGEAGRELVAISAEADRLLLESSDKPKK
jgi:hypothetical protein